MTDSLSLVNSCQIFSECCFVSGEITLKLQRDPIQGEMLYWMQISVNFSHLDSLKLGASVHSCTQLETAFRENNLSWEWGRVTGAHVRARSVCQGHVDVFKCNRRINFIAHWQSIAICLQDYVW